jgi:hypothetical protein
MTAVFFWIETVEQVILVPPLQVGQQFDVKGTPSIACANFLRHSPV